MRTIEVLGSGCANCHRLADNARQAATLCSICVHEEFIPQRR